MKTSQLQRLQSPAAALLTDASTRQSQVVDSGFLSELQMAVATTSEQNSTSRQHYQNTTKDAPIADAPAPVLPLRVNPLPKRSLSIEAVVTPSEEKTENSTLSQQAETVPGQADDTEVVAPMPLADVVAAVYSALQLKLPADTTQVEYTQTGQNSAELTVTVGSSENPLTPKTAAKIFKSLSRQVDTLRETIGNAATLSFSVQVPETKDSIQTLSQEQAQSEQAFTAPLPVSSSTPVVQNEQAFTTEEQATVAMDTTISNVTDQSASDTFDSVSKVIPDVPSFTANSGKSATPGITSGNVVNSQNSKAPVQQEFHTATNVANHPSGSTPASEMQQERSVRNTLQNNNDSSVVVTANERSFTNGSTPTPSDETITPDVSMPSTPTLKSLLAQAKEQGIAVQSIVITIDSKYEGPAAMMYTERTIPQEIQANTAVVEEETIPELTSIPINTVEDATGNTRTASQATTRVTGNNVRVSDTAQQETHISSQLTGRTENSPTDAGASLTASPVRVSETARASENIATTPESGQTESRSLRAEAHQKQRSDVMLSSSKVRSSDENTTSAGDEVYAQIVNESTVESATKMPQMASQTESYAPKGIMSEQTPKPDVQRSQAPIEAAMPKPTIPTDNSQENVANAGSRSAEKSIPTQGHRNGLHPENGLQNTANLTAQAPESKAKEVLLNEPDTSGLNAIGNSQSLPPSIRDNATTINDREVALPALSIDNNRREVALSAKQNSESQAANAAKNAGILTRTGGDILRNTAPGSEGSAAEQSTEYAPSMSLRTAAKNPTEFAMTGLQTDEQFPVLPAENSQENTAIDGNKKQQINTSQETPIQPQKTNGISGAAPVLNTEKTPDASLQFTAQLSPAIRVQDSDPRTLAQRDTQKEKLPETEKNTKLQDAVSENKSSGQPSVLQESYNGAASRSTSPTYMPVPTENSGLQSADVLQQTAVNTPVNSPRQSIKDTDTEPVLTKDNSPQTTAQNFAETIVYTTADTSRNTTKIRAQKAAETSQKAAETIVQNAAELSHNAAQTAVQNAAKTIARNAEETSRIAATIPAHNSSELSQSVAQPTVPKNTENSAQKVEENTTVFNGQLKVNPSENFTESTSGNTSEKTIGVHEKKQATSPISIENMASQDSIRQPKIMSENNGVLTGIESPVSGVQITPENVTKSTVHTTGVTRNHDIENKGNTDDVLMSQGKDNHVVDENVISELQENNISINSPKNRPVTSPVIQQENKSELLPVAGDLEQINSPSQLEEIAANTRADKSQLHSPINDTNKANNSGAMQVENSKKIPEHHAEKLPVENIPAAGNTQLKNSAIKADFTANQIVRDEQVNSREQNNEKVSETSAQNPAPTTSKTSDQPTEKSSLKSAPSAMIGATQNTTREYENTTGQPVLNNASEILQDESAPTQQKGELMESRIPTENTTAETEEKVNLRSESQQKPGTITTQEKPAQPSTGIASQAAEARPGVSIPSTNTSAVNSLNRTEESVAALPVTGRQAQPQATVFTEKTATKLPQRTPPARPDNDTVAVTSPGTQLEQNQRVAVESPNADSAYSMEQKQEVNRQLTEQSIAEQLSNQDATGTKQTAGKTILPFGENVSSPSERNVTANTAPATGTMPSRASEIASIPNDNPRERDTTPVHSTRGQSIETQKTVDADTPVTKNEPVIQRQEHTDSDINNVPRQDKTDAAEITSMPTAQSQKMPRGTTVPAVSSAPNEQQIASALREPKVQQNGTHTAVKNTPVSEPSTAAPEYNSELSSQVTGNHNDMLAVSSVDSQEKQHVNTKNSVPEKTSPGRPATPAASTEHHVQSTRTAQVNESSLPLDDSRSVEPFVPESTNADEKAKTSPDERAAQPNAATEQNKTQAELRDARASVSSPAVERKAAQNVAARSAASQPIEGKRSVKETTLQQDEYQTVSPDRLSSGTPGVVQEPTRNDSTTEAKERSTAPAPTPVMSTEAEKNLNIAAVPTVAAQTAVAGQDARQRASISPAAQHQQADQRRQADNQAGIALETGGGMPVTSRQSAAGEQDTRSRDDERRADKKAADGAELQSKERQRSAVERSAYEQTAAAQEEALTGVSAKKDDPIVPRNQRTKEELLTGVFTNTPLNAVPPNVRNYQSQLPQNRKLPRISADNFASSAVQMMQTMPQQSGGSMRLQLAPEALGTVTMQLNVRDKNAVVRLEVETTAAKQALEAQIPMLREQLGQQGITADKIDIQVRQREDFSMFSGFNQNNGSAKQEEQEARQSYLRSLRTDGVLAPDTGHEDVLIPSPKKPVQKKSVQQNRVEFYA